MDQQYNAEKQYTFLKGMQHEIYIGIKDKDSYEEIITVEEFKEMLADICAAKNIGFTLLTQVGGYSHNLGYTTETSLRIVVIGADEDEIFELGERLKKQVNTDTILIARSEVEFLYL